jgi:uroporphyrinogen-III synthase
VNPFFFLTRVDPVDDALALQAAGMGFAVIRESLLATEPGVDAPGLADHLLAMADGTGLAWTSRRAAEVLATVLPTLHGTLDRVPLYAVGEESALPVRHAGLSPRVPPEPLGAAELARFIASRAPEDRLRRVVFLHGNRSLPDLPDGLREMGIPVEFLEVYRTRFLAPDFGGLEEALRSGATVLVAFFSPSGVEAFERLLHANSVARFREHAIVISRGHTTTQALRHRGYRKVLAFQPGAPFSQYAAKALQETPGGTP